MGYCRREKREERREKREGTNLFSLLSSPFSLLSFLFFLLFHDFKRGRWHSRERRKLVLVPARIRRPADEPSRPIVGDEHSVLHHRPQHHSHVRRKAGGIEIRLETHAHAHCRKRA